MKALKKYFLIVFLLLSPIASSAAVITGKVDTWLEYFEILKVGQGDHQVAMDWSVKTPHSAFFYRFDSQSYKMEVAHAKEIRSIHEIVDASKFVFTNDFDDNIKNVCDAICSPTGSGEFVIYKNIQSGHFAVFQVGRIFWPDIEVVKAKLPEWQHEQLYGFSPAAMDGTWWFQTDGSANFSQIPTPSAGLLLGTASLIILVMRKAKSPAVTPYLNAHRQSHATPSAVTGNNSG